VFVCLCCVFCKIISIFHRDIKCENIFVNGMTSDVQIGDFGLAEFKPNSKFSMQGKRITKAMNVNKINNLE